MTTGTAPHPDVSNRWSGRPLASRMLRVGIVAVPVVASFATAWTLSSLTAVPSTFAGAALRWLLVAAAATVVLLAVERLTRRLAPLATLLALSLTFPDRAPSRFRVALQQQLDAAAARPHRRGAPRRARQHAVGGGRAGARARRGAQRARPDHTRTLRTGACVQPDARRGARSRRGRARPAAMGRAAPRHRQAADLGRDPEQAWRTHRRRVRGSVPAPGLRPRHGRASGPVARRIRPRRVGTP